MVRLFLWCLGGLFFCVVYLVVVVDLLFNCFYLVIYGFGDFFIDVGNGIVVFLEKFKYVEIDFYGI